MFTGIIEAVGVVRSVGPGPAGVRLQIDAPELGRPIPPGCSLCVSGVCLTVVCSDASTIAFDVVAETLRRSTLGALRPGSRVNLERSLRADGRLEGHLVQGHVDGTARVRRVGRCGGELWTFAAEPALGPYIIPKGSIALDGVSLTIAEVAGDGFGVALIPATLERTTLGALRAGDAVNVETDVLVRAVVATVRRLQGEGAPEALTAERLQDQGW